MFHHIIRHGMKHVARFYAANPHKAVPHAAAAVQIGSTVWTHSHKVAKHSLTFMAKAASKGFNLFRS